MLLILFSLMLNFKVKEVTIYSSSAKIVREAVKNLSTGEYTARSNLIPGGIDGRSIRIKAPEYVTVGEVRVIKVYPDTVFKKEIKVLEDSIEAIQDKIDLLTQKLDVLKSEEEFVNSIKVTMPQKYSQELYSGKTSTLAWTKTLKFLSVELERINREKLATKKKQTRLKNLLKRLKQTLNDLKTKTTYHYIEFPVLVKRAGTCRFILEYVVSDVKWMVNYIVRAFPDKGKVLLEYHGKIRQTTGEDWKDIHLILSTKSRITDVTPPFLEPWYIQFSSVKIPKTMVIKRDVTTGVGVEKGAQEKEKEDLSFISNWWDIRMTGISVTYRVPGKRTIPSGKSSTDILINSSEFDANFFYYVVPKQREAAFLKAEMENDSKNVYLPGDASIFVGPEYTGNGRIDKFTPGEKISISCGVDNRIKVERELIKKFVDKGGVFSKKKKVEYRYRNLIRNGLDREIDVNFIDCIPVPRVSDITVKDVFFSAKPDSMNKDKGLAYWHLKIPSHETFVETTGFKVEYPEDKQIAPLIR